MAYLVPAIFVGITVVFFLGFKFEWYRCRLIQFNLMGLDNDDFKRLSDTVKNKILGAFMKVNILLIIVSLMVSYFSIYLLTSEILSMIIPNILNMIIFVFFYIRLNHMIKSILD